MKWRINSIATPATLTSDSVRESDRVVEPQNMGIAVGVLLLSFTSHCQRRFYVGAGEHSPPSPNRSQALKYSAQIIVLNTNIVRLLSCYLDVEQSSHYIPVGSRMETLRVEPER